MADSQNISERTQIAVPHSWRKEMSILLKLGLPMAAAQLVQFSIFFFDTVMIARIGPIDVAAAALGSVIYFLVWMVGSGPVMAVSPLVSQALGANPDDKKDPRRSVRMAIWVCFLMLPFMAVFLCFTETIALKLGQDPQVARKAQAYILILSIGLPFGLAVMVLRNFLAALGKTMVPLLLVTLITAINIALNYVFIFGKFGAPRLELVGAGLASSLSYIAGFFIFMAYIKTDKISAQFDIFARLFKPDWPRLKETIRLGVPISITTVFEGMLFNVMVIITGIIGVMEQSAYAIALNVVALAFMLPYGLSMAGGVRIGLARGAKNSVGQSRAASTTLTACVAAIICCALPIALFPSAISTLYVSPQDLESAQVRNFVTTFLPLAAGFMLFDAMQVGSNQLLRGLKDVKAPIWITGVSYWLIGFPLAYYLALHSDVGVNGVWFGLMASLFCAAIGLGIRLLWQLKQPLD